MITALFVDHVNADWVSWGPCIPRCTFPLAALTLSAQVYERWQYFACDHFHSTKFHEILCASLTGSG